MSCLGTDKLNNIYEKLLRFPNSDMHVRTNVERPEQELIAKFLPSECCVLEMGGESGTTSLIIDNILKDPSKHVLVEPSLRSIGKLANLKNLYKTSFHVAHGFVGRDRSTHEKLWDECKKCQMFDLCELENIVNQKFDVLIIDCEGAFCNIVKEIPEILDSAKLIIIEMDGADSEIPWLRNILFSSGFELVQSHAHPYFNNGNKSLDFGEVRTVEDLKVLKSRKNLIGFHEVYVKFS